MPKGDGDDQVESIPLSKRTLTRYPQQEYETEISGSGADCVRSNGCQP